jgi:hypothetical protein
MEPDGLVPRFPHDLEPEERTTLSLQIDPLDQLIGGEAPVVYPKRIPVRKFASFIDRLKERIDELAVAGPFFHGNPVGVASKAARQNIGSFLCCYVIAHRHPSLPYGCDKRRGFPAVFDF